MGLGYLPAKRLWRRLGLRERAACALLAALALLVSPSAHAQVSPASTDSATAEARAVVLDTGEVIKVTDIDFGRIARPTTSGTIIVSPSANATCTVAGGLQRWGACQAAEFVLKEKKKQKVRIRNMTGNTIVLTGPGGATMNMTNMTIAVQDLSVNNFGTNQPGTLGRYLVESDTGFATFWIGGTLNVNANQASGQYVGTFDILVQLQ